MIRLVIFALALFGLYALFFKDKRIVIQDKNPKKGNRNFTDYEEI